ncbi:MAG: hypothetical protein A2075_00235 [Geobacteraceae bacterium GWC2_58_44]|nr:MAG: hypothetical protein A2075_00235 [Geobacteraceae bacterium GWC2_58_44]HBG06383.1 hypothetical protein [Geobacter sp.]
MELFTKLRDVALRENESGEFPSWLLAEVMVIAEQPERYADRGHLVRMLIAQIADFDPYAGTGCFNSSVGAGTIRATISQIIAEHNVHGRGG